MSDSPEALFAVFMQRARRAAFLHCLLTATLRAVICALGVGMLVLLAKRIASIDLNVPGWVLVALTGAVFVVSLATTRGHFRNIAGWLDQQLGAEGRIVGACEFVDEAPEDPYKRLAVVEAGTWLATSVADVRLWKWPRETWGALLLGTCMIVILGIGACPHSVDRSQSPEDLAAARSESTEEQQAQKPSSMPSVQPEEASMSGSRGQSTTGPAGEANTGVVSGDESSNNGHSAGQQPQNAAMAASRPLQNGQASEGGVASNTNSTGPPQREGADARSADRQRSTDATGTGPGKNLRTDVGANTNSTGNAASKKNESADTRGVKQSDGNARGAQTPNFSASASGTPDAAAASGGGPHENRAGNGNDTRHETESAGVPGSSKVQAGQQSGPRPQEDIQSGHSNGGKKGPSNASGSEKREDHGAAAQGTGEPSSTGDETKSGDRAGKRLSHQSGADKSEETVLQSSNGVAAGWGAGGSAKRARVKLDRPERKLFPSSEHNQQNVTEAGRTIQQVVTDYANPTTRPALLGSRPATAYEKSTRDDLDIVGLPSGRRRLVRDYFDRLYGAAESRPAIR